MSVFYKINYIDPATGGRWSVEFYPAGYDWEAAAGADYLELDRRTIVVESLTLLDFEHKVPVGLSKASGARISVAIDIKQPNCTAEQMQEFGRRVVQPRAECAYIELEHGISQAIYWAPAGEWQVKGQVQLYNVFHLALTLGAHTEVDFWGVQDAFTGKLSTTGENIINIELTEVVGFVLNHISFRAIFNAVLYDIGRFCDSYFLHRTPADSFFGLALDNDFKITTHCVHYFCAAHDGGWGWEQKGKTALYGGIISAPVQYNLRRWGLPVRSYWEQWNGTGWDWRQVWLTAPDAGNKAKQGYGWLRLSKLFEMIEVVASDHLRLIAGRSFYIPDWKQKYYRQTYDNTGGPGAVLTPSQLYFKAYERHDDYKSGQPGGTCSYNMVEQQSADVYEMLDYETLAEFLADWYLSDNSATWYANTQIWNDFRAEEEPIKIRMETADIGITLEQSKFKRINSSMVETYAGDREFVEAGGEMSGAQDGINSTITFHARPVPNRTVESYVYNPAIEACESYRAYLPINTLQAEELWGIKANISVGGFSHAKFNLWLRNDPATETKLQLFYVEKLTTWASREQMVAVHHYVGESEWSDEAKACSLPLRWGELDFRQSLAKIGTEERKPAPWPLYHIHGMQEKIRNYFNEIQNISQQLRNNANELHAYKDKQQTTIKTNITELLKNYKGFVFMDMIRKRIAIETDANAATAWLAGGNELRCYNLKYDAKSGDVEINAVNWN